ncbi:hypothetical protein QYH69_24315 [Paraburkholderia sp. SARCC-3016]|uniref:hypothetical protein n=1 Tax=Paraburkholderia sp. SARCC-3016 TaxID=3058611 RepID=UPI002807B844|nr:hypothetical protein [Paraburkholderia sp. SARCC-3016]MDQ7980367.1 hypothetical protein [Paraburkholderia sp. SARCC-3016]
MGSIIEMVIVLVAAAALTVQGIREDIAHKRAQLLQIEGQNEEVINSALSQWVTDNFAALLDQFTQSGSPDLTPPTVDQLFTSGNLKQPHRNGPFWGGQYIITMSMVPAGCTQEAGDCHVSYVMYPSLPVTKSGVPDVAGAGEIARAGGISFGFSKTQNSSQIDGINGAWHATNPLGNQPAVILATNGPGSDGDSVWIARDGHLTWTGSQNVNGVDLHNVGNIDAQGTIAAPTVAASNVAVSNAVRSPATLFIQNAAGTAPAPADMGQATLHGALQLANIGVPRAACTPPMVVGNSDGSGQVLTCQGGQLIPVGGPWTLMQQFVVANGSVVPAPVCSAGGAAKVTVAAQNFTVDPTAVVNFGASAGSGPWVISITDGSGTPIGALGTASTFCEY